MCAKINMIFNKAKLSWGLTTVVLVTISSTCAQGAFDIWEIGNQTYGEGCVKNGLGGILWVLNAHCKTYGGSVGCFGEDGKKKCDCNQGADAYFDAERGKCLAKAVAYDEISGALCNVEINPLLPNIECTPNAECVPMGNDGGLVGLCRCLYGFNLDNGRCIKDETIQDGDRSTERTRTTTERPIKEKFRLPPLNILLATQSVGFNQVCHSKPLLPLNRTICETHKGTVFCKHGKCECNMQEDSVFDEELNMCVGKVGTWCLARENLLGIKGCTKHAECVLEDGKSVENHSFGRCRCVKGYMLNDTNIDECILDENATDPETPRPIITERPIGKPTTTKAPDDDEPSHGVTIHVTVTNMVLSLSMLLTGATFSFL